METGHWIWADTEDPKAYNQAYEFYQCFELLEPEDAQLKITADSRYRVWINGHWVNDGPGKAYPEHWTYDQYSIGAYLQVGSNEIRVLVRYLGIGTFHQIPQMGGLLAEIHSSKLLLATDGKWLCRPYTALLQWVPKISVQMEPVESFDAERLNDRLSWSTCKEICAAESGPWRNLKPRGPKPLTKLYCDPIEVPIVRRSRPVPPKYTVPVAQLAHPGLIEANHFTSRPVVLAAHLEVVKAQTFDGSSPNWQIEINGALIEEKVELAIGFYNVRFYCISFYGHKKDLAFPYIGIPDLNWSDWQLFVVDAFKFYDNDRLFGLWFEHREANNLEQDWLDWLTQKPELFDPKDIPLEQIFLPDYAAEFCARDPYECLDITGDPPTIPAADNSDIELCYDFGNQRCGYLDFELEAPGATVIDFNLVEFIRQDGVVQHSAPDNRNGLRYHSRAGVKEYCSLKRRSGRYLFVTIRSPKASVKIHRMGLIESTAPVETIQLFKSSDENLNQIWRACERTLKLCMEDVFTDCPLYEQTLWIGDARNQALYAAQVYGDYSLSERSLELGAQSLAHFPIVGCQVPSTWDCLLPAWSFLWGIHVWEHYFITGDRDFWSAYGLLFLEILRVRIHL